MDGLVFCFPLIWSNKKRPLSLVSWNYYGIINHAASELCLPRVSYLATQTMHIFFLGKCLKNYHRLASLVCHFSYKTSHYQLATYWTDFLTPGLTGTYAYSFPSINSTIFRSIARAKTQELGCPPTTFVTSLLKNGILHKTYPRRLKNHFTMTLWFLSKSRVYPPIFRNQL